MRTPALLRRLAGGRPDVASSWTVVDGLRMHARVPAAPAPVGAPAVVLVHGLGVSGRYMVPTLPGLAPWSRLRAGPARFRRQHDERRGPEGDLALSLPGRGRWSS